VNGRSANSDISFPPAIREERGIERCTRCIQACGKNAACNVQPLVRVSTNLWKSRKCHYCTIFPAELEAERCSLEGRLYLFNHDERRLVPVSESGEQLPALKDDYESPLASPVANGTIVSSVTAPITPPPEKEEYVASVMKADSSVAVLPDVPQPTTPDLKSQDIADPVTPPTATMSSFGLYTPVATPSLEKSEKKSREQPSTDAKPAAPPSPTFFPITPLAPVRETAKAIEIVKPATPTGTAPATPTAAAWLSYFNGQPVNEIAKPVEAKPVETPAVEETVKADDATSAPSTPAAANWLSLIAKPAPKPVETVKPATLKPVPIKPLVAPKAVEPAPAEAPVEAAPATPTATATPPAPTAAAVLPQVKKIKSDRRPVALAPVWTNKPSFDREAPPTPSLANFGSSTPAAATPVAPSTPVHTSQFPALPVPVESIYARPAAPAPTTSSFTLDPISQLVSSRRPAAVISAVSDALHTELATLEDITSAIAELKRLLALKEEEHAAQLRKVDSYRTAIDDALNAIDEEQRSLRTMRARLAGALA